MRAGNLTRVARVARMTRVVRVATTPRRRPVPLSIKRRKTKLKRMTSLLALFKERFQRTMK